VIYLCCDERRRSAVRAFAGLNGIDFLEVVDNDVTSSAERQRSLRVHFLKSPAPPNIQPANVQIDGGERIRNITVDAVAYDARVIARREGEGPIDAELIAVPRAALDPQLAALGPVAPALAGIDVAGPDGVPLQVNLLPLSQRQNIRDPWQTWNLAFAAVAVIAAGLALWQVLENRRAAADAFDAEVEREAVPARRAAAQQQELVNLIEGQAFLQRTRAARPTAVEVMDELSRRLPDGSYLEKLAIEDDRLTLIGLSNEAPALIGRLQDSKLWHSPALAGALQTDPVTHKDRFTLTAELGPANASKEAPSAAGE